MAVLEEHLVYLIFVGTAIVGILAAYLAPFFMQKRFYTCANVTTTFVRLVEKHLEDGSRIQILGSDAHYLYQKPKWKSYIRSWLTRGCSIRYLLVKPNSQHGGAEQILDVLHAEFPDTFQWRALPSSREIMLDSSEDSDLISHLETFHFVTFSDPEQMWLEGHHPAKRTQAYDCEYVPPRIACHDSRYSEYRGTFERIWSKYGRPSTAQKGKDVGIQPASHAQ